MSRYVLLLCLGVVGVAPMTFAQIAGQRQYYDPWIKHSSKNYYYRYYRYKKSADAKDYTHHYGIYYPSRGKRVYMYNPHVRKYWGVWEGKRYSLLPKEKQKSSIDEIAAEDFPPPGDPPNIPGIEEKIPMIPPPNDFPKLADDQP